MIGTLLTGICLFVCIGFLFSSVFTALWWLIMIPFNIAHAIISFCMWALRVLLSLFPGIISVCTWALRVLLSLFPGVSGLLDFLFTTAVHSVFQIHALFVWDNVIGVAVLGAILVKYGSTHLKKLAALAYLAMYCATFLYITLSTLLPMFLLAATLGLASKAIASFFPRVRPKYSGPIMGFAVSLLLHFFFIESPHVIFFHLIFDPCS
jgi:hypothetical protein